MILKKTIRVKIFGLTAKKEALLLEEYNNWQSRLRGDKEKPLIAATKQQADRLLKSLGKNYNNEKEYPLALRNDSIRVERAKEAKWSDWWFKVPVAGLYGGVWCPIVMAQNQEYLLDDCVLRESKLIRKENQWFIHIVVQNEFPDPIVSYPRNIVAVNLGEVRPATAVLLRDGHYQGHIFASKKVREIRMHYSWLRQQLSRCKCFDAIKKIGRTEHRKVDAELHGLSKEIVQLAKENNAIIVIGDLKGIRKTARRKGKNLQEKSIECLHTGWQNSSSTKLNGPVFR
jgi:putative transposase